MHPVQAAPRQRLGNEVQRVKARDAPRAGSAEAKTELFEKALPYYDAPRAGSAEAKASQRQDGSVPWAGCTPCRQRRGKGHS